MVTGLSRHVWVIQGATFVTWLGSGAVAPFVLVYLHEARGYPLGTAGLDVAHPARLRGSLAEASA
jgi:hypothetical protein